MSNLGSKNYKVIPFGLLAVSVLFLISTAPRAESNCQSFEEQLSASGLTPYGGFNGGASVSLGGGVPELAQVTSVIIGSAENFDPANPAPIEIRRAGGLLFKPSIDGSVNVLTVVLDAVGVPIGLDTFSVSGQVRFTGGVGRFEHAHGKASFNGTSVIDLMTGQVQFDAALSGKICNVDDDGDSDSDDG